MSYAIICNARKGKGLGIDHLALVDRQLNKKIWWTSDNSKIILNYLSREAAEFCVKRLKKNNARIVDYEFAKKAIRQQADCIQSAINYFDDQAAKDFSEAGWDGHKSNV